MKIQTVDAQLDADPMTMSNSRYYTGILNQMKTKLRDWVVWQARAGCYSQALLSSNDSKTL